MKKLHVLGVPLLVTNYDELAALCLEWALEPRCRLVEFVNTQIVTMQRHESDFAVTMKAYNDQVPDGMPLVWCLNRAGAGLRDRVYGPTFMRQGVNISTWPQPSGWEPTSPCSKTWTSKPASIPASAASSPTGPAPITASVLRAGRGKRDPFVGVEWRETRFARD